MESTSNIENVLAPKSTSTSSVPNSESEGEGPAVAVAAESAGAEKAVVVVGENNSESLTPSSELGSGTEADNCSVQEGGLLFQKISPQQIELALKRIEVPVGLFSGAEKDKYTWKEGIISAPLPVQVKLQGLSRSRSTHLNVKADRSVTPRAITQQSAPSSPCNKASQFQQVEGASRQRSSKSASRPKRRSQEDRDQDYQPSAPAASPSRRIRQPRKTEKVKGQEMSAPDNMDMEVDTEDLTLVPQQLPIIRNINAAVALNCNTPTATQVTANNNGSSGFVGVGIPHANGSGHHLNTLHSNYLHSLNPFESPVVPKLLCANGALNCDQMVSASFPCVRCHKEFYCSEKHRSQRLEEHKQLCKTASRLEEIFNDDAYNMWYKKAASNLYDICLNFVLVWPSLTAQWLPDMTELENNVNRHRLLLGTQTNGEMNHLIICGIDVSSRVVSDMPDNNEFTRNARHDGSLYVIQRINHEAEVHRARYMPQNSNIIATKSPSSDVFVFDCSKNPELPVDNLCSPNLRLRGHTQEGFGLAWNPNREGRLISGSSDKMVCLWDINGNIVLDDKGNRCINSFAKLDRHTDVVEDVAWHHESLNICASVGDDRKLVLWDIRENCQTNCVQEKDNAHEGDINAIGFSSFSDYLFATGSSDRVVGIWDMRFLNHKLHKLEYHKDDVMQVEWSPHDSMTLASTGKDKRVFIWNLSAINDPSQQGIAIPTNGNHDQDLLPEPPVTLQFIHGGHVSSVNDIGWNLHEVGMVASVAEDNILQVWKIDGNLNVTEPSEEDDKEEPDQSISGQEDI